MDINKRLFFLSLFAILLFLLHCSSKPVPVQYNLYEINFALNDISPKNSPIPFTNATYAILPIQIDPAFATKKIVVRTPSKELEFFSKHLWAEKPTVMIGNLLKNYIEKTKIFKGSPTINWETDSDYFIRLHIYQLLILNVSEELEAFLYMELELINNHSNKIEVANLLYSREIVPERNLDSFVQQISQMLKRGFMRFEGKTREYFEKNKGEITG
jgi:ABC-type uncharacterized transport system auxiliary subunit